MADERRADGVRPKPPSLTFHSILFPRPEQRVGVDQREAPAFFRDLNLGPVIESITNGRDEYRLTPFFYAQLTDIDSIIFRQEVLRDLEDPDVWACIATFAQRMRAMREQSTQADKLYYQYQKESWFLDAVATYDRQLSGVLDWSVLHPMVQNRTDLRSIDARDFEELVWIHQIDPDLRHAEPSSVIGRSARFAGE